MGLSLGIGLGVNKKDVVSSDFTPATLGSTMVVWYKNATGITNLTGADTREDNRLTWSDQSGNNNHAIQDTNGDKPDIDQEGYEGGLKFELDDTDTMDLTGALEFGHPNPFTFFFVVKRETITTQQALIGSTGANQFISFASNADKLKVRSAGTGGDNITFTFATSGLWVAETNFILTVSKDSAGKLLVYKNGVHQAESGGGISVNDGATMTLAYLGSKTDADLHNFDGGMLEIILCDTVLSTDDRNDTITYLKNKFSIS